MKIHGTLKSLTFISLTSLALVHQNGFAVEALSDDEMGDLVVLDPFGATAAGVTIDTTLEGRSSSADQADENNVSLANDPNNRESLTDTPSVEYTFTETLPEQYSNTLNYGINIQTQGNTQRVSVDTIMNNPGNALGGQSYQNLHIDNMSVTRQYR